MTIWRWAELFTETPPDHRITLGEGDTPLIRSRRIGPEAGLDRLYFKLETSNPSGSYKDRFAAAAISYMRTRGETRTVGTSSGNTGSAVAAYCAAAGLACEIAILETTPPGKIKQMQAYGAQIYRVRGMGVDPGISDRIMEQLQDKAQRPGNRLQISAFRFSPDGMNGVKTIGYELAEQADAGGFDLRHVFVPAGGGGLTLAVARGLSEMADRGSIARMPAVHCVQPSGNDTIAGPLRDGATRARACPCTSLISGLQVGSVIDGDPVIEVCRASGGTGYLVEDEDVWAVQRRLARDEGVFCEPAGAVALAAALAASQRGAVRRDEPVACLVTGVGFKDPDGVDRMIEGIDCPLIEPSEIDRM